MTVHVQCNNCGAWGLTENHGFPDGAAQCRSAEDDPPGSPEGSCCPEHESLDHHLDEAARTGDSRCRPVTITVVGVPIGGGVKASLT
jgi:hypothetical protein